MSYFALTLFLLGWIVAVVLTIVFWRRRPRLRFIPMILGPTSGILLSLFLGDYELKQFLLTQVFTALLSLAAYGITGELVAEDYFEKKRRDEERTKAEGK